MDIYSYINSPDVQKYLASLNYSFDSLESAWLIWQSRKHSIKEKIAAWLEIIQTMPDCEIPEGNMSPKRGSLHGFLQEYITSIDKEIEEFYKEEPDEYVYQFSYEYCCDQKWVEEYDTVFPTLEQCLEAYKEVVKGLDETFLGNEDGKSAGVIWCRLKKQSLKLPYTISEVELNEKGDVMEVIWSSLRDGLAQTELENTFESLCFNIPTPFEKGDIVWDPASSNGPFVLMGLSSWDAVEGEENSKKATNYGDCVGIVPEKDTSDMNGFGLFVDDNGLPYHEVMFHYLNLEYYYEQYKEYEKILLPISKFVKGKIGIDLLLCAYRNIILQKEMNRAISYKSWHLVDELEEVGLAAEEDN